MARALVTGGAGFLGSHIADALSERGFAVSVFDRSESEHLRSGQRMVTGDLLDAEALSAAAAGCDCLFHLAALSDLEEASSDPVAATRHNVLGTVQALEAARRAGVKRFLFASTVYVYSRAGGFYRCSKQAGEAYVEEYGRQFDVGYTILRYGSLYGPRATEANGVYRLLRQALEGGSIRHIGHPDDSREYVHVEDAALLSVDALGEEFENQRLVITGHYPMRLRDLFTMFSEILGRQIEVDYEEPAEGLADTHYRVTPYAFSPRVGRKLTANSYVDMGQGILQMLEEMQG
ncbi:MAG: NAD-dependent epimerase/dehydratase family protein [Thermoanaerobaculia bacterium]